MKKLLSTLIATITVHHIVSAHPSGHSEGLFETVVHFASQPDHLFGWMAGLLVLGLAFIAARSIAHKS